MYFWTLDLKLFKSFLGLLSLLITQYINNMKIINDAATIYFDIADK